MGTACCVSHIPSEKRVRPFGGAVGLVGVGRLLTTETPQLRTTPDERSFRCTGLAFPRDEGCHKLECFRHATEGSPIPLSALPSWTLQADPSSARVSP